MDAINAPGLNRIHEYTIQQIIVAIVISLVIYVFVQYSPIAAIQLPTAGNTENQPCQESKGVIDEKDLRTWDSEDVLAVYDSLVRAHESINKLALVPESF